MSIDQKKQMDAENNEILRTYNLTNVWLAHSLLKLARAAQASSPQFEAGDNTYEARMIYGVIPEVCRRIGIVKLNLPEIDWVLRDKTDYQLRIYAGHCLHNISNINDSSWSLISAEFVNGNPVCIGLDRLCPGNLEDKEDIIVKRIAEVANIRGVVFNGIWTPEILNYNRTAKKMKM